MAPLLDPTRNAPTHQKTTAPLPEAPIEKGRADLSVLIYLAMADAVKKCDLIHTDDTVVRVVRGDKKHKTHKGRMWVYIGEGHCVYEYTSTRAGVNPSRFLVEFKGKLQADGYAGYNAVAERDTVVLFLQRQEMKEAWCLVSSRADLPSQALVTWYGKRWGIESSFKDIKDYKCGMGMKKIHTGSTDRRDRIFLISALAIALLALLGAAGDAMGLERYIKANTEKKRMYSFFRQGCVYYALLPGMKTERLRLLMRKFSELLAEQPIFRKVLGLL